VRSRARWFAAVVALSTILCVGCFSFAVDYSSVTALLQPQGGAVAEIIQLLDQGKEQDAAELLDKLCEAAVEARAVLVGLYFAGDADNVSDPFVLPAGAYRVHLKTDGAPFVAAIPLAEPDSYDYIFSLMSHDAVEGISAFYSSDGERIVLEFTYVDAPYELWFEEIS